MARPEVTGRRVFADGAGSDEVDAFTVPEFCRRHKISVSFFYKLVGLGKGPRLMKAGTRTLVTKEAAADWRREREAASAA